LCAQTTVALLNSKGDPIAAINSLCNKNTLKSLGITMATASIMHGVSDYFDIWGKTAETLADHAAHQSINAGARLAAEASIAGRTDGRGIAISALAGTLGGALSSKIGNLYASGDISKAVGDADFFVHKVMHALKGAGEGFIIGGEKGIRSGVLGAAVSEVVADIMAPTAGIAQKELSADQAKSGGSRPRGYGQKYTDFDIKRAQCIAKISVGALAFAAGFSAEEINIAVESATTSLEHNFATSAMRHAGADMEHQNLAPEEQEFVKSLYHAVTDRYEACVNAGMSHDQAIAHVQAELHDQVQNQTDPKMQKMNGLLLKPFVPMAQKMTPALLRAIEKVSMGLSDVVRFVRTGINLDQFFKESSNEGNGASTQTKPSDSAKSSKGSGGNPPPEEPKDGKNKKTEKRSEINDQELSSASHEKLKTEYRSESKPLRAKDDELNKVLESLHRDTGQIGNGSTGAAVRHELQTGQSVGGKEHIQKLEDGITYLSKWLKNNETNFSVSNADKDAAFNMLKDLLDAAKGMK
jgi:hypothetical protein